MPPSRLRRSHIAMATTALAAPQPPIPLPASPSDSADAHLDRAELLEPAAEHNTDTRDPTQHLPP